MGDRWEKQEQRPEDGLTHTMTGRAKWVVHNFSFMTLHILRKAEFNTSSVSRQDESRGSRTGTDLESMDISAQALSQLSLSSVTTSTPT